MELPIKSKINSRTASSRPIFRFLSHASSSYSAFSFMPAISSRREQVAAFSSREHFSGTLLIPHRLRNGVLLKYFRAVRTRQLALRQHHRRANKSSRKEKVLRVSQRRAASVSGRWTCKNEIDLISFPVPFWAECLPFIISVVCRRKISHFAKRALACGRFSSGVQRNLLTFHPSRATHKTRWTDNKTSHFTFHFSLSAAIFPSSPLFCAKPERF